MPSFQVKVKWGKELYNDVELNTDEEPVVFKAQLFALTGVQPNRQKVMIKGAAIKDESWENVEKKMKNGATLLLMGSKEEDIPKEVTAAERIKFVEDMDESQIKSELKLPAGLTNLGNTCYLNATLQCFKTVPELKMALQDFDGGLGSDDRALTSALRDLYRTMDKGQTIPPLVLVQLVHNVFPRFAERGEQGGFQQQDANECWIELMGVLKRHLTMKTPDAKSVIDTYFGLEFEAETKCVESEEEPVTKSTEHFLQYNCYIDKDVKYLASGLKNRLQESMSKHSSFLDRDAEYMKTLKVSRLPGYLTVQMVRFQFKQKEAMNAKILKDIKFPMMLDCYEYCKPELQEKLVPMRSKFKENEDAIIETAPKGKGTVEGALKKAQEENEDKEMFDYWFEDDLGSNNSGYYELQAVLTHKGRSSNSGHYVAWVKYKGDTWIECNDDDVNPIHVEDVLKLSGGGDWHTAYLLLYGPRKLAKDYKKPSTEEAKASEKASEEEKMET